jgi:hypothetical protein
MKDSGHAQLSIIETDSTQDPIKTHDAQSTSTTPRVAPQRNAASRSPVSARVHAHDVPRVMLTIGEAASSLGVSSDTFRRFVLPELRVVRASPRLTLVRVAELERWASRREALADLD